MGKIIVLEKDISIRTFEKEDYISLTDIARYKNDAHTDDVVRNWLRNRNTIEFLGIWERLNNPDFKPVEFDGFKIQAGLNSFTLTPKQWIGKTRAIGILSKSGRSTTPSVAGYPAMENELEEDSVIRNFRITAADGKNLMSA